MKKIISLIMSVMICASAGLFSACKKEPHSSDGTSLKEIPSAVSPTHYTNRTEMEGYLANNGVTEYQVVYSADGGSDLLLAVDDFVKLFEESTNAKLPKVLDSEVAWDENKKYISIGQTTLLEAAGITVDEATLKSNGTRAVTKGNSIFVFGAKEKGCVNAVYKFLESLIGFDRYSVDCYSVEKHEQLKMYEYDMLEVPDFEFRIPTVGYARLTGEINRQQYWDQSEALRRMTVTNPDTGDQDLSHTSFTMCPPELYDNENDPENYHPGWYSDDGKQLCYTAHGNQDEWNAMVEQMARVVMHSIKVNTAEGHVMFFYIEDNGFSCGCKYCEEQAVEDGSICGAVVRVANAVMEKVNAWWETEEGKEYFIPDFVLAVGAYNDYAFAPVKQNAEGEYEATIKAGKGVGIMYAPAQMQFNLPFEDERNASFNSALEGWGLVSDNLQYWLYSTDFRKYLVAYNAFDAIQAILQKCNLYGNEWMYYQSQHNQRGWPTGWNIYKCYLESKLLWNVNVNVKYYEDKFFENYFGEVSDVMHDLFISYRTRAELNEENGYDGGVNNQDIFRNQNTNFEFWPIGLLENWLSDFDIALQKIEYLKEFQKTTYDAYYKRIVAERLWLYYVGIEGHGENLGQERLLNWKLKFKEGANLLGISHYEESATLATMYSNWGI